MIKAENLCFSYAGSPPYLLGGINLEIQDGEYLSVMGENGCGKTTFIKLVLRLLKPTSGFITHKANRIGYVPQKKDINFDFPITVREMLNSYRKLLKIGDKEIIGECLERVGMASFGNALMGTLSGGQNQKIFIARALMGSPDLLILDEPSAGVDMGGQKEIYGFLSRLNKQNGITIVSVEHNLRAAVSNSTLIYHLSDGRGHLCSSAKFAAEYLNNGERDDGIV